MPEPSIKHYKYVARNPRLHKSRRISDKSRYSTSAYCPPICRLDGGINNNITLGTPLIVVTTEAGGWLDGLTTTRGIV